MVWTPGQPLQGGKYVIDRVLGVGGFGITYLATQNSRRHDQKPVVIKTLKDEVRHDPKFANYQTKLQQDFLNEALKLAKCLHPHIVEVQEIIREGNLDCIVMEFVQGESLADRLSRQGVLSEAEALRYIQQVGEALTVVHNRGLLHRDIKPQNIMIRSGTSEAVLIDFGLAREFMQDLIQTHSLALTHGFAPPEQYDRQSKRGAYTDIYALAATLYCSLTNHIPHAAYMRLSGTVLESPQQLNPGISDRVNQAILKGLELRAENRPQSMQEWLGLLEEAIVEPVAPVKPTIGRPQLAQIKSNDKHTQHPSRKAAKVSPRPDQNLFARRQSRTIPWVSLALVLIGYATTGAMFTISSVPLWVWASALGSALVGVVAGDWFVVDRGWSLISVMAGVGALGWAYVLAGAVFVAGVNAWAWASTLTMVGSIAVSVAAFLAVVELLKSFGPLHTFLILAGASLAGLSLGWLIGIMLQSSYPQLFGML